MTEYSIQEIKNIKDALAEVFDIVRLVNPIETHVINIDDNNCLTIDECGCYQVWNKNGRCENCISSIAINVEKRMTKYEFVDLDVFHIVSKPIIIVDNDKKYKCVIEIVAKITDDILFGAVGKDNLMEKIIEFERKVYIDSLTGVYNRRYFDEMVFCINNRCELRNNVVFIMVDLKEFKNVNDIYGHIVGDKVLYKAAQAMTKSVRKTDSVIRFGGDEFLIVLNECNESAAKVVVNKIKENLKKNTIYDNENKKYASADFGISYAEKFVFEKEFIENMVIEADKNMYLNKQNS